MTEARLAAYLNGLSDADARDALARCCDSARWVHAMLEHRPYDDDAMVRQLADAVWGALTPDDWLEAFAAHPRIGTKKTTVTAWSREEQAGMSGAAQATRARLEELNRRYEERFGHVFLICATGRSADEMLAQLERRIEQDPAVELREAAEEQRKIMHLRLGKLIA